LKDIVLSVREKHILKKTHFQREKEFLQVESELSLVLEGDFSKLKISLLEFELKFGKKDFETILILNQIFFQAKRPKNQKENFTSF